MGRSDRIGIELNIQFSKEFAISMNILVVAGITVKELLFLGILIWIE
jgi:hypothetical protein